MSDTPKEHCPGCDDPSRWASEGCPGIEPATDSSRAALSATTADLADSVADRIRRETIEECAKAADDWAFHVGDHGDRDDRLQAMAVRAVAAKIRRLVTDKRSDGT